MITNKGLPTISDKRALLVAAENGALPGGKVGGIGDVVRDLPKALAELGWQALVVTPAYGAFDKLPAAEAGAAFGVPFAGLTHDVVPHRIRSEGTQVQHLVLSSELLDGQNAGQIYFDDGPDRPFASDASKFAFFCAAVASYVSNDRDKPDVVHLHDWHAAFYLLFRAFDPNHEDLKGVRTVYTIHNLALQGIRPFAGDDSSFDRWYPDLQVDRDLISDPRYPDCVNPMATAIRLADAVNTVSPTYAREVLKPSDPPRGFVGGEGLERDLQAVSDSGNLFGILNGCEYGGKKAGGGWRDIVKELNLALGDDRPLALSRWQRRRPKHVLTSVGRLTQQKVSLMFENADSGQSALQRILDELGRTGLLIILGSGDPLLERHMADLAERNDNLIYVRGYFDELALALYRGGDLFLMPSSFEPCGISQMLAMREGQPCVVHGIGGLADTVDDLDTGFVFQGGSPAEQAGNFAAAVARALHIRESDSTAWADIRSRAAARRFTWKAAARSYTEDLYGYPAD